MRVFGVVTLTMLIRLAQGFLRPWPQAQHAARSVLQARSTAAASVLILSPRSVQANIVKRNGVGRLFSSDATEAPSAPAAEGEKLTTAATANWVDATTARISWDASASPSPQNTRVSYRLAYNRVAGQGAEVPNWVTVASPEATLRGLDAGSEYRVSVYEQGQGTEELIAEATLKSSKAPEAPKGEVTELSRLEIRVGRIVEIGKHPDADSLYVEKVDVGEAEPRTIVSGLVKYQTEEQLTGREVIVLCNLKPRAMRGVTSHGMLLCASDEDHTQVEPLSPPEGVPVGELITFEGHAAAPEPAGNRASKAFDRIAADLFATDDMVASYKGTPFMTSKGAVKAGIKGKIS